MDTERRSYGPADVWDMERVKLWPLTPEEDQALLADDDVAVLRTSPDLGEEWEGRQAEIVVRVFPDLTHRFVRQRIISRDTPVWAERRYLEDGSYRDSLRGIECTNRDTDVGQALPLLKLLRPHDWEKRGRPLASTLRSDFERSYVDAYHDIRERNGSRPTQVEVAAELFMSTKTLGRWLKKFKLPWPPK